MALVSLKLFLPEVLPDCPGAPELVAVNAIRNACIEFCRRSLLITEIQTAQPYTAGTQQYSLAPLSSEQQLVKAMSVTLDDSNTVYPFRLDDVVGVAPDWQVKQGGVQGFIQPSPTELLFVRVPDTSGTFVPVVATAPTRVCTTVDNRLYDLYLETVKLGALARLKAVVNSSFSDPSGAAIYAQQFLMGVNAAVVEKNMESSRALLRVEPRPFV